MIRFNENKAWLLLNELAGRGKRPPGTKEHKQAIEYLFLLMQNFCSKAWLQPFSLQFRGKEIQCANICGFFPGKKCLTKTTNGVQQGSEQISTILLGSHFDTRWIADNDEDVTKRNSPIPGVNDGTSGVAVILELARIFSEYKPNKNVILVLFDAEDLGNIDGIEFSVGADRYARFGEIRPDLVIALDMVGGKDMHLNIDLNSLVYSQSKNVFQRLFDIGRTLNYPCFFNNAVHMIISDHYPFLKREIPALLLIDIEYPQWHTHSDTINYCSRDSLKHIGDVLLCFLTDIWPDNQ